MRCQIDRECTYGYIRINFVDDNGVLLIRWFFNLNPKRWWRRLVPLHWLLRCRLYWMNKTARVILRTRRYR